MMPKRGRGKVDPKYYVNCLGEVIMKPDMYVQKLRGEYIILDASQIEEPRKFMVIGKNATWQITASPTGRRSA